MSQIFILLVNTSYQCRMWLPH